MEDYDIDIANSVILAAWAGRLTGPADVPASLRIKLSGRTPSDLMGNSMGLLMVSPRLAEVFTQVAGPAALTAMPIRQYLKPAADYLLINVNRSLSIKGHYPKKRKKVDYVIKTALDYNQVPPDLHLFRIDEVPGSTFLSGRMAVALAEVQPVGIALITIDNIGLKRPAARQPRPPKPKRGRGDSPRTTRSASGAFRTPSAPPSVA